MPSPGRDLPGASATVPRVAITPNSLYVPWHASWNAAKSVRSTS
jgi:hypothetical protein